MKRQHEDRGPLIIFLLVLAWAFIVSVSLSGCGSTIEYREIEVPKIVTVTGPPAPQKPLTLPRPASPLVITDPDDADASWEALIRWAHDVWRSEQACRATIQEHNEDVAANPPAEPPGGTE